MRLSYRTSFPCKYSIQMKLSLTLPLLLMANIYVSALTFGQTFTYKKSKIKVEQLLNELQRQTGYNVFYDEAMVPTEAYVEASYQKAAVETVLSDIARKYQMSYRIVEKNIVLSRQKTSAPKTPDRVETEEAVQQRTLTGTVRDSESRQPLSGVTVQEVGHQNSTSTDDEGKFVLQLQDSGSSLRFSLVGYHAQEEKAGASNSLSVQLIANIQEVDEVVVVGYGTQKRGNLTGAVSTIDEKALENRVATSAAKMLQGADPSLNITFGSGAPDQGYGINIRGVPSVNGGNPLIMADGVEVSLSQINPHDIESVTVLKDASASAIYGAKASSGVILITTKSGENKGGSSEISYIGRTGFSQNTTSTDFIRTGYDHVKLANQFYRIYRGEDMALYDDEGMALLEERRNDLTEHPDRPWTIVGDDDKYYYYGNTDWYGHFYRRTRPQQEHSVSARGGTDKVKYYTSGRYWTQDGMFNIHEDTYRNYSFYAKVDAKLKPWLAYTGSASFNSSMYKYAGMHNEQQTIHSLQSNIYSSFVPFNPDGSIVQYTNQLNANSPIGAGHGGFLSANKARNSRGDHYMVLANKFDFSLTDDLLLTAMHTYKKRDRRFRYRNMPFEYSREVDVLEPFQSGTIYDYYQESHYDLDNHNVNVYGAYSKSFSDHNLNVVIGSQFEDYRETNLIAKQDDLLNDDLSSFAVANGEITLNQSIGAFRTLGFFGRANYDYRGKYLLEVSGRWDGTSRFAAADRWGFFPSASLGWRMDEENFWQGLKSFWDTGKLRFSMGSLGNQQVDYYAYIEEISASNLLAYTFDGSSRANYASVSNPISSALTWETVTMYNLGVDFTFLKNRLSFTGDAFIRKTTDMLTPTLTLPAVYGASTPQGNAADLKTRGWEFKLDWRDQVEVGGQTLRYNVGVGLGDYTTTITKFNNPDRLISDHYVGRQLGEIWGYRVKGLFATDEEAADYQSRIDDKAVNNRVYTSNQQNYLRAGDVEFIDLNGDGIINQGSGTVDDPGDRTIIGNTQPRYNYSMQLGADWGGIDISAFFQGVGKRDWYPTQNAYYFWGPYSFPSLSFIHNDFLTNTWSEENPNAYFPKPRGYESYSSGSLGVANDRYLQRVAYLRLKNLTIGYTLPIQRKWMESLRLYITGENIAYWSPLKKYSKTVDPELTVTSATYDSNSGVGYNFPKTFIFGVNVKF